MSCTLLTPVRATSELGPRVVGGEDADPGEYPYFVSWAGNCGATVIHDDLLLTAAHCKPLYSNEVVIGAYSRNPTDEDTVTGWITDRIEHPGYDKASWQYDIMLLKLYEPVPNYIPRVTLNNDPQIPRDGSEVTVIGMGRLGEDNDSGFPSILQEVNVNIVNTGTCNSAPMYPDLIYDENMICAAVPNGGQDACFGDSGGPLLQNINGVMTQIGTVSFGIGCARSDKPGVYGRVSAAYDWIEEMICTASDVPPARCQQRDADTSSSRPSLRPSKAPSAVPTAAPSPAPTPAPTVAPSQSFAQRENADAPTYHPKAFGYGREGNEKPKVFGSSIRGRNGIHSDFLP